VEACGIGSVVAKDASAAEIAAAVGAALSDEPARAGARRFAEAIAILGAGESATDDVEHAALSKVRAQ
jgi:UDP:flavonoid glycosyltransferase YjiC (YdhE family)